MAGVIGMAFEGNWNLVNNTEAQATYLLGGMDNGTQFSVGNLRDWDLRLMGFLPDFLFSLKGLEL